MQLQSSNPVLKSDVFEPYPLYGGEAARTTASVQGVINKTVILVSIALVTGGLGYAAVDQFPGAMLASALGSFVVTLITYFWLHRNPQAAIYGAPIYAAAEGFFLGAFTGTVEAILAAQGIELMGGIALQAFVITIASVLGMLALYSAGIIRKSPGLVKFLSIAVVGICITYGISFLLALFGVSMPLISMSSAMQGGTQAWIGLGINALILGIAALTLVLDFGMIEEHVAAGAPKRLEWYCGFALLVTLAWIYFEAVRLLFRLAIILNDRR
jgi:uncharacterized YccA/Bax inhibitor family protein